MNKQDQEKIRQQQEELVRVQQANGVLGCEITMLKTRLANSKKTTRKLIEDRKIIHEKLREIFTI